MSHDVFEVKYYQRVTKGSNLISLFKSGMPASLNAGMGPRLPASSKRVVCHPRLVESRVAKLSFMLACLGQFSQNGGSWQFVYRPDTSEVFPQQTGPWICFQILD